MRHAATVSAVLAALAGLAPGSIASAQQKQRPFDRVSGVLFACAPATGFVWTGHACEGLTAEYKKRAEAAKLPFAVVPITADISRKDFGSMNGFNADKAVRVRLIFKESASTKGRIHASLSSSFIYEPTTRDHPNVAPGQRIPMNFYSQEVQFEPGVTLSQAQKYLDMLTGFFFNFGEAL